jgi:hypothetical protein
VNLARSSLVLAIGAFAALAASSCHASYHPLQAAEACRCSPREYCNVRPSAGVQCLPLPARCGDAPSCACLGRPIDACREELGALTVLEPRPVPACDECSSEEYCWMPEGRGAGAMCGVIPARCEDTPTCECFVEARRVMGHLSCSVKSGRIEASPAPEVQTR